MKSIGKIGIILQLLYLWHNPYRVSRLYLQKRGAEDVHQYGETPLETVEKLGVTAGITSSDHVFDLGCGRGRAAFFLKERFGCKVTGIEQIPLFVKKARWANWLCSAGVKFRCEDFCESDLSEATVIYLYGTCLSEEIIVKLCNRFLPHQRIISVSYPLSAYNSQFSTVKKTSVTYPWGNTEAYVNSCGDPVGMRI